MANTVRGTRYAARFYSKRRRSLVLIPQRIECRFDYPDIGRYDTRVS
jgi:hypothetical protein